MVRNFIHDEAGFIISSELIVIVTLLFCGTVVGLTVVRDSVTHELHDISEAVGSVSQSYNVTGLRKGAGYTRDHARVSGFGFNDTSDDCDCIGIRLTRVRGKNDPSDLECPEGSNS